MQAYWKQLLAAEREREACGERRKREEEEEEERCERERRAEEVGWGVKCLEYIVKGLWEGGSLAPGLGNSGQRAGNASLTLQPVEIEGCLK